MTEKIATDVHSGRINAILVTSGSVAEQVVEQFPEIPASTVIAAIARAPRKTPNAPDSASTSCRDTQPSTPSSTRSPSRFPSPSTNRPMSFPEHRPRRLRRTPAVRRLARETHLVPSQLVLPMFVREGISEPSPIGSMPGIVQHSMDSLRRAVAEAAEQRIGGVMLFGVPEVRDAVGSGADDPNGILNRATEAVVAEVGDALVVQTDLCLDEFTDHGHCGVLQADGSVDNDATLERYTAMGLAQARAGSAMLGLSGMMDGQVGAVREALDAEGFTDTLILAYSAKYAGAFYGPFRERSTRS